MRVWEVQRSERFCVLHARNYFQHPKLLKHSRRTASMAISECPQCTFHIAVQSNMAEGDVIACPDCGVMLKLIGSLPPVFELAEKEE